MATDTPPTDAGERRRSVVRSSPEVPFSGFYSRANAATERRAAAARNAIIEWSDWTPDPHPTRRTRLRTRHYGWFLRKPRYWRTLRRAGAGVAPKPRTSAGMCIGRTTLCVYSTGDRHLGSTYVESVATRGITPSRDNRSKRGMVIDRRGHTPCARLCGGERVGVVEPPAAARTGLLAKAPPQLP